MNASSHQILIIGLGEVAQSHLRALAQVPGADVIAAVDIAPKAQVVFRGHPVPAYQALREASERHDPDVVAILTPTPTHADVCAEAADCFPAAKILLEKPAAGNLRDARHVLEDIGSRQPVEVAYHMSFSPEVTWGLRIAQDNTAELGAPLAIEAAFADPYQEDFENAQTVLGNSWLDSGINSLSVLSRFAKPLTRTSLRRLGGPHQSVFEARLTCQAAGQELPALILTSWHVTDPAKTTRIRYSTGAELVMDHTAVAGHLIQDGQVAALFGSDRSIPRRDRHYIALYDHWLTRGTPIMPALESLRLHELLLQPSDGVQP